MALGMEFKCPPPLLVKSLFTPRSHSGGQNAPRSFRKVPSSKHESKPPSAAFHTPCKKHTRTTGIKVSKTLDPAGEEEKGGRDEAALP